MRFHHQQQPCGSCGTGGNSLGASCDKTIIYLIINKIKQNMQKISNIPKEW